MKLLIADLADAHGAGAGFLAFIGCKHDAHLLRLVDRDFRDAVVMYPWSTCSTTFSYMIEYRDYYDRISSVSGKFESHSKDVATWLVYSTVGYADGLEHETYPTALHDQISFLVGDCDGEDSNIREECLSFNGSEDSISILAKSVNDCACFFLGNVGCSQGFLTRNELFIHGLLDEYRCSSTLVTSRPITAPDLETLFHKKEESSFQALRSR